MKNEFITFPLSNRCSALTTTTDLGNMAYHVDSGQHVLEHRSYLANLLNVSLNRFVFVHQSHSDKILKVKQDDLGKGVDSFIGGMECDGLYTYLKNVPLCIFHADCVPVFFVDESSNLVGIIHAGYEGTLKHVVYKSIKKVIEEEGIYPSSLKFYIGPYRRQPSFELDEKSMKEVIEADFSQAIQDNHFDNGLAVKIDLHKLGIKEEQIEDCLLDTFTDERFFSAYRFHREQNKTPAGRMVSLIYLK